MRRLMLIAGLTLGLGIVAVFVGVVYRISTMESGAPDALPRDAATPTISLTELGLSADARIVSSALDGDSLALTYDDNGQTTVILFHLPDMTVTGRLRVTGE